MILLVVARWCRYSRQLEREVLRDPRVAERLRSRCVCIRVDKDRRPDLAARYTRRGWPTLVYMDGEGRTLASDGYIEAAELLERVEALLRGTLSNQEPQRPRHAAPAALSSQILEHAARLLMENADPRHGGWGQEHKFPHSEGLDFALYFGVHGPRVELLEVLRRTLNGMQAGELHDQVEGGFYRYATRADWGAPNHEKLLESNAQRLRAYVESEALLNEPSYRATARGILEWLDGTLFDPTLGAYRGGQDADENYARLPTKAARARRSAPACDPTIYCHANAILASTLFRTAQLWDDPRLASRAERMVEFLTRELYDPQHGFSHYYDGARQLPGLLIDQAHGLHALLCSHAHSGVPQRLKQAEELVMLTVELLRAPMGGFYDTPFDAGARGSLRERQRPILENSILAEGLLELARRTENHDYHDLARETLESFAGDYKRYGHFVAGYARAVALYQWSAPSEPKSE